jgi:hypothetical protein
MSSLSLFLRFVICDGTISSLFATFGTLLLTDAMLVKVPFVMGTISSLFATFGALLLTDAMLVKVPFVRAR